MGRKQNISERSRRVKVWKCAFVCKCIVEYGAKFQYKSLLSSWPRDPALVGLPRPLLQPDDPPDEELQLRGHFPHQQGGQAGGSYAVSHDLHLPAAGLSQHLRPHHQSFSAQLLQFHDEENNDDLQGSGSSKQSRSHLLTQGYCSFIDSVTMDESPEQQRFSPSICFSSSTKILLYLLFPGQKVFISVFHPFQILESVELRKDQKKINFIVNI